MMRLQRNNDDLRELIEENKPLDRKKIILRFTAFLIFLALAITFITIGITSAGKRTEGLQLIEAEADKEVLRYQLGVSFQHWFTGSSSAIRMGVKELGELYSSALKDAFRMLDARERYEDWANLATLNQSLGREVTLNQPLYEVLRDAARRTAAGEGYSMFAGALYAEWEGLRYALDPAPGDPLNDPAEAERLERLRTATAELSNFSLEFLDDAACTVRFTVDQDYLELLAELELEDAPILDLNVLTEAYKLQLVAQRLEDRGYDRGFLLTDSGLMLALSGYTDGGVFRLYGLDEKGAVPAAELPIEAGSCTVQLRAFGTQDEPGYYALESGETRYYRHPWLPADGEYRNALLTALVSGKGLSAPDACCAGLRLLACDSAEEAKTLAVSLPGDAAFLLTEEPRTIYSADEALAALPDSGYQTASLP